MKGNNRSGSPRWSRRLFSAALVAAPLAGGEQNDGNSGAIQDPPPPGKRPPIEEPARFDDVVFSRRDIARKSSPFPLAQVRLLPGPCQQAADWNRAYMLRLTADRLLHNFRRNAGLPSSGRELGGWESPQSELRGHFTGHYLSACALRYASAGDQELKARGDEMVAELARCQKALDQGGYLSAFPEELFDRLDRRAKVWAPFYTAHKIMAGLLDMYGLAGNRQALDVVTAMAGWTDRWTASRPETHMQAILRSEYGGMNEVLYNVAAATGDSRWARTGDRFNKKAFFAPLAQHRDVLRNLHANTHIPQVIGAARRFELSSDTRFRDVAEFFWYTIASSRTYATGGSSNAEAWLTDPGHLSIEYHASTHHQECCCAYNMMKLTRQLYSWSGDPRYFDYYERNLFNHRLGGIQPETGHSIYFLSMSPGAWKTLNTEDRTFWCCTGSALEDYSKLGDSIYFRSDTGIAVNLFIASELDARDLGVQLRQDTKFPDESSTTLTIGKTPNEPWTLRLRIPSWCRTAAVRVNGRRLEATPGAASYLSLHRTWKKGDRVDLDVPMDLTVEPMPDDTSVQALLHGPIVLAGDLGAEGLTEERICNHQGPDTRSAPLSVRGLRSGGKRPEDWIKPANSPGDFVIDDGGARIQLRPLNRLWGRFATYWTVS